MNISRRSLNALRKGIKLPIDENDPVFHRYAAFKLGVRAEILYYANLMVPMVRDILLSAADVEEWLLTSQPITAAPGAANLLCEEIGMQLEQDAAVSAGIACVPIRRKTGRATSGSSQKSGIYDDYSRLKICEREAIWKEEDNLFVRDRRFSGGHVVFINDSNVTGSQQRIMEGYFDELGAVAVHWVYIVDFDREAGAKNPEIEHSINSLGIKDFKEFSRFVADEEIDFTHKCISLMLGYDTAELTSLVGRLDAARRAEILRKANAEGFDELGGFKAKLTLLRND